MVRYFNPLLDIYKYNFYQVMAETRYFLLEFDTSAYERCSDPNVATAQDKHCPSLNAATLSN